MQITRDIESQKGPAEWFTGDVYIDPVAAPEATSTFAAAAVHFTPRARTPWHTHPHGQTIYVTEGAGLCQREGGPVEVIRPGHRVFFEPAENHWHGAAPNRFMVHIALQQNDETGSSVTWGEHVTDEQYPGRSSVVACREAPRWRASSSRAPPTALGWPPRGRCLRTGTRL
jgi:quercetin dioxygenase-like cupin family protein